LTGDARFANFENDPRFRLPSKKHTKAKLDPRFSRLRSDPDFYNKATVDKYGRKISKDAGKKAMDRLYEAEDDEDDEDDDDEEPQQPAKQKRDKAVAKELARVQKQGFDPIRDGGLESSSDESSSDEDEPEIEDETELAGEGNEVPTGDISARLAAVNMDWDNMRAIDIMGVANSFVPPGGRILNVVIYPSEFGMERLQREEIEGPPREIFASSSKSKDDLTALDHVSADDSAPEDEEQDADLEKEETGEEFDTAALRSYQLDRLRYYYAVITCSSADAAKSIYDNLDGREYLTSANFFDLRFVPDGTTFDQDPHDECSKLPDGYKPNEFSTDALTHSRVKLTWDADDTTRKEVQKRAFSRKEIDENELKAYLGSDSSSSEDEAELAKADKASKTRALFGLDAPGKSKPKPKASAKRDRDFPKPDGEMQITFTGGLLNDADKGGSVFENEIPINETTAEKYVRKEKERKLRRKAKYQAKKEGRDPDADPVDAADTANPDDGFNDPFFASDPEEMSRAEKAERASSKKSKKAKKRDEEAALASSTAAERANLELLMAGDDAKVRHFDMADIVKSQKAKKKGSKKNKDAQVVEDDFKINTADPRFAKIYESHEFAIDPTNPRFKETEGMKALLEEGRKKRKVGGGDGEDAVGGGMETEGKKKKVRRDDGDAGGDDMVKKLGARIKAKSRKA
jgi:hypothetical protein